ncbi:hypothetical protein FXO37_11239 [Capsicum annuum]|nr:hypothetical protein FXO37_11239 [Capsicum annuum]
MGRLDTGMVTTRSVVLVVKILLVSIAILQQLMLSWKDPVKISIKTDVEILDIPLPELQGLKTLKVAFCHAVKDEVELSQPDVELRLLEVFYRKIYETIEDNPEIVRLTKKSIMHVSQYCISLDTHYMIALTYSHASFDRRNISCPSVYGQHEFGKVLLNIVPLVLVTAYALLVV